MRLMRGSGPRGLAGPAPIRPLARAHWLVRPMLATSRADAERICALASVPWRHDATNDDTTRLRSALRARVIPILRELAPGVERRAAHTATLLRQSADIFDREAAALLADAASPTLDTPPNTLSLSRSA